jgi:hypothetical protein
VCPQYVISISRGRFTLANQVLNSALEDSWHRGNPGRFRLINVDNLGWNIVPVECADAKGNFISVQSPLDVRISFPEGKRRVSETLRLIASSISSQFGKKITAEV